MESDKAQLRNTAIGTLKFELLSGEGGIEFEAGKNRDGSDGRRKNIGMSKQGTSRTVERM